MLEVNRKKIKCPIFFAREKVIQALNYDIWREGLTSGEIINKAHSLWFEADFLVKCPKYNSGRFECKMCKAIAELRRRTAGYMIGTDVKIKERLTC